MEGALLEAFLANVAEPARFGDAGERPLLEARLGRLLAAAAAEWPTLRLDAARFIAYVAARLPGGVPADDALAVHAGDLLLAQLSGDGDAQALRAFEDRHLADARVYLGRFARTPERLEDVLQIVRERLFVGNDAKITQYTGRGPLGGWLRMTLVNTAITIGVREDRLRPSSMEGFEDALFTENQPDLAAFKERYGPAFRAAFQTALGALTPEEINFLRWHVVEGKSVDAIGARVGISRATAARRIAACRTKLYESTRDALAERLPGSATELKSMMGALKSVVETSLRRFLAPVR